MCVCVCGVCVCVSVCLSVSVLAGWRSILHAHLAKVTHHHRHLEVRFDSTTAVVIAVFARDSRCLIREISKPSNF